MALKVDYATSVESRTSQISASSSPAAVTGNTKVSKFGMKSGFVIPKNKLSGSLVPIFKGAGKVESSPVKEESNKQVQRKTKWGTDLAQDVTVQKGRALAYQTRVEQITKQLKSGVLEKGDEDFKPHSPDEVPNDKSSSHQVDDQPQKLEMLELEKREAIGEILKLNPSYKAPLDYKPVMREASIPVPVKLYPGLNFVSLILGPGSDTQKRLEEETGAKIQIQGTKAGSTEKVEVALSDKNDVQGSYEELYVHVVADTFEKVDAAVSLIELLVNPVSGNSGMVPPAPSSVSGDGTNLQQDTTSSQVMPGPLVNQGVMQSMAGPMQPGFFPQVQFQPYPAPWFPAGPMHPPNNFGPPSNSNVPTPNNAVQYPNPPLNPSNMQQFLVGQPPSAAGSAMATRNPSLVSPRLQPPPQGFQWPYFREAPPNSQGPPPRMHAISGSQQHVSYPSISTQPSHAMPHQGAINHPRTTGPGPGTGPGPMMHTQSQPSLTAPSGQPPHMPLASSGWSAPTVATPSQQVPFQGASVSQPQMLQGTASSNMPSTVMRGPSGNVISPGSFPPRPSTTHLTNAPVNRPIVGPNFSFVIHQRSPLAPGPASTGAVASMPALSPSNAPSSTLGPSQAPSPMMPPSPAALSAFPRGPSPGLAQAPPPGPAVSPSLNKSSPRAHMQPVGQQRPPNQSMVGTAPVPQSLPAASQQSSVNPGSTSGNFSNFTSSKPPMSSPQGVPAIAPRPQRPSSGDFTFRPLGSSLPVSQTVPRPSDQPSQVPSMPPNSLMQPPSQPPPPQTPSYRPAAQNSGPQLVMQSFPTTRPSHQMFHPQSQSEVRPPLLTSTSPFTGNPSPNRPPRFSEFANPNPIQPTGSSPRMGPRSFTQAPQMSNFPGQFPPRMMNPPQMQQNQMGPPVRPGTFLGPNQQYGSNPAFSTGRPSSSPTGNQVYDPFSPSSVSSASQHPENPAKVGKQEDDPEYDDLMASVGVR